IAPGTRSSSILAINAGRSCAANSGADPGSGAGEDDDPDTAVVDPADELSAPQAELTRPTKAAVAPASHAAEGRLLFRRPVKDIADSKSLVAVSSCVSARRGTSVLRRRGER